MSRNRVTIQNIAEACGLSRNTVSKVFNNRGTVPESTKQLVLEKAKEMGYFAILENTAVETPVQSQPRSIAVFSRSNALNHTFGLNFIKGFTDTVCRDGYVVQMYGLSEEEIESLQLPQNIALDNTVGILGIEMFDRAYIQYLCGLGIPAILADSYYGVQKTMIPCDVISMENYASICAITQQIIDAGAKTLGFVGDSHHCNSFYERYAGFCFVLHNAGIEVDKRVCIMEKDGDQYADLRWTEAQLRKMPYLPDAFVCANDFHALRVMLALKKMGISMPDDIMIAGFGDSAEASVIDTGLTTAEIPSNEMGIIAANVLLARISNKERPYGLTYIQTRPIFRGSTKSK